ncbi:hypothetical protein P152DRAFT_234286 [Eremomyces bilateralis CBS 781.70]|uniref:Uncharacterized protein n=1 Tax=Eremomyces bilateralis CBS 781.70 TaxID=1392243 RepID=A0A6G1GA88_9PEZI|nr:uncharacterized protein P152DRAFT_234286 [Eremomyces bilateralis CBS 781.70]KAF1814821.1 hypothetical protein P152DRAFT_234286 [Eremomyces bilateralis CBS 781.70]
MAVPPSPLKSNPVDLSPAERRTSHFSLSLDRDRTTSRIAAIRRGELKISAPIPMAESTGAFFGNTVATPQEERGSYIQCGGTPDLAQGEMTSTRTTSRRPSTPAEAIKSSMTPTKDTWEQPDRQGLARSTGSADGAVEPSAVPNERGSVSPQVLRHKFSSEDLMNRRSTMKRPTSPGASPPFATPIPLRNTPMSSNGNTATPTKKKQRRSGTIKSVFRRMFTSKRSRVDAAQGESPAAKPSPPRHEYHRSDPGMIPEGIATRGNGEGDNDQSPTPHQRNHSVPIRRFSENISEDPGTQTPIRAHLPFPMNVNAPQTSSPTRQRQVRPGIDASSLSPTHKRRATLPSVILPVSDDPSHNPFLDSPNITQPRGGASDAAQIGLALTTTGLNNGSSQKANPNRRSRSAGALRDLADRGNNQADSRPSLRTPTWSPCFGSRRACSSWIRLGPFFAQQPH